ncbi:hypothetical protein MSHOH_3997 [Methanosarcina horonobensis HB-1 = JCM 15518]|uniref:DUF1894 domain-containing protein n=2 Tax=Methanosarcina horonobensis TaxID=418008 RepID=A0A0E3WVE5_9EURY|nr:hypothetical protein MSHOH_3997 [Methanosarcina horonobensis HB-1 = JCM 15518]
MIVIEVFRIIPEKKHKRYKKMVCLSEYDFEILLKNATPKECENFIKERSDEVYLVPGGYSIKGIFLLGTAIPVGFSGNAILFQFIKPCFGLFVLRMKDEAEEIKKLREQYKKDKNVKKIK